METVINIYMLLLCTYGSEKKKSKQHSETPTEFYQHWKKKKKNPAEIGGE